MTYREITIYTATQGVEIVAGFLTMQGVRGCVIEDAADFNAFLEDTEIHWDYVDESLLAKKTGETNVKFYLPDNAQGAEGYRAILAGLPPLREQNPGVELGRLAVETASVDEEDWSTAWKKYYHPTRVGERLTVVPCWEEYAPAPDEVVVTRDPGMAFGTGTHETTRLCMRLLEGCVGPDTELLDVGTGSGILAIAGLLLGARRAVGVDIDELAVKIAGENAALNGVSDRLTLHCGDLTEQVAGRFGVVCANIVADVILRLAKDVKRYLLPGGALLCSGIIEERCQEVQDGLRAADLTVEEVLTENGWAAIRLRA